MLRYEDNGDAVNNLNVLVTKTEKKDISEYGDPKAFLEQINYIFGDQVFIGEFCFMTKFKLHCSWDHPVITAHGAITC